MKKIAYVVALGLGLFAYADEPAGQPLFSIASDALAAAPAEKTVTVQAAPAEMQTAKSESKPQKTEAEAPNAPLFNVSADALASVEAAKGQDKVVVQDKAPEKPKTAKTDAREPVALQAEVAKVDDKKDAREPVALQAEVAKADDKQDVREPVALQAEVAKADDKKDAREPITLQPKSAQADGKAQAETTLFKIASYYEADEMGDSDDAVRKIDVGKPQAQKTSSDLAAKAEKKVAAERAIAGSKAIQLAAPATPKKQKGSYSYVVRGKRYQTLASSENFVQEGAASWYGPGFHGRKTASGEIYDMHKLTAAHKRLPLGTKLEVTNKRTGKSVVVTVNDRGPFHGNRILDLSHAAASQLGLVHAGVGEVTIRAIK